MSTDGTILKKIGQVLKPIVWCSADTVSALLQVDRHVALFSDYRSFDAKG